MTLAAFGIPSPIIHHPFNFGILGFNFTGFGLAVLLAFLIAQIVSERDLGWANTLDELE